MSSRLFQDTDFETLQRSFQRQIDERLKLFRRQMSVSVEERVGQVIIKPSALVNEIVNSDFSWSKDAFETAGITPATAGDGNRKAYNFYRHTRATTLLVEDDAHALKNSDHSTYAANEGANADIPDWAKTDGWARMGHTVTAYTLDFPLSANIARPGSILYFQIIVSLEASYSFPSACQLSVEIHDNTAGQEKPLEAANMDLAAAMVGAVGATSLDYFVVATDDWGHQVKSDVQNVANANAVLDGVNYVSLSWTEVPGAVDYSIYKKNNTSGLYYLVFQVQNGSLTYFDTGTFAKTVAGFPAVTDTKAKAYVETDAAGKSVFSPANGLWVLVAPVVLRVPSTYNMSLTTGKQWVRVGLTASATQQRKVLIDHIGLGRVDGAWQESQLDKKALSPISTAATSSTQGSTGSNTGGSDGRQCPAPTMPITVILGDGSLSTRQARYLKNGDAVLTPDGPAIVRSVRWTPKQRGYELISKGGRRLVASPTTPVIRHASDNRGTPLSRLKAGDRIFVFNGRKNIFNSDTIQGIVRRRRPQRFIEISLFARHRYIAGGIVIDNVKLIQE